MGDPTIFFLSDQSLQEISIYFFYLKNVKGFHKVFDRSKAVKFFNLERIFIVANWIEF